MNDHARSAAQATILINGGAATVVIALSTKEPSIGAHVAKIMPYALGGYALGVMFGALMMFFMIHSIQRWAIVWQGRALGYPTTRIDRARRWGNIWHAVAYICFGVAIILFLIGSAVIAGALLHSS